MSFLNISWMPSAKGAKQTWTFYDYLLGYHIECFAFMMFIWWCSSPNNVTGYTGLRDIRIYKWIFPLLLHQSTWLVRLSSCLGRATAGRVVKCAVPVVRASALEIPLAPGGRPCPQVLTLFGRVWLIAWHRGRPSLGECWRGPKYVKKCPARVGYGSAPGPTLKRPCTILIRLVGRMTNSTLSN